MRVLVTPLRRNGFRLPHRDLGDDDLLAGTLIIHRRWIGETQTKLAAQLHKNNSVMIGDANLIATLFEPQLKSWQGAVFHLTGWEVIDWKSDGRQVVIQEWACRIEGF